MREQNGIYGCHEKGETQMAENRPRGRQKNVSGQGKGVYKRGSGLFLYSGYTLRVFTYTSETR